MDGKSVGKGLSAATTHSPEQVIFTNKTHILDSAGRLLLSMIWKKDKGMVKALIALGERIQI